MITYVNSGNDAKRFNTFALAAKHSLIKKQQSINTQIDYLKNVYNSYVSHYNQLQKLIKEINDLTGESKYTNVDYSDFPAVDITASFSMKTKNVRLVPEGTSSLRFKNTIEDLRSNFSDLSLSIKSFYSRIAAEVSPYSSMKRRTDSIREGSSSATAVVSSNINTALTEGDLSTEDWSTIKEKANESRDSAEKSMSSGENEEGSEGKSEGESEEERKLREEAEKVAREAAREAFDMKQAELDEAAADAQYRLNMTEDMLDRFGDGFYSSGYVNQDYDTDRTLKISYFDPFTGEQYVSYPNNDSYIDGYGSITTVKYNSDTHQWTIIKDDSTVGTYDNEWEALTAADEAAGKDVFSKGVLNVAQETYEESKQKAKENNDSAQEAAQEAAAEAEEHAASDPSNDSSGGT